MNLKQFGMSAPSREQDQPDFRAASARAAGDERLKAAVHNAVMKQHVGRLARWAELPDAEALRMLAGQIRQHAIDHLDHYLEQFAGNVERRGGVLHFAGDGAEAQRIVLEIARRAGCTRIIKSKSMVSEEIGLNEALESAGLEVVETDLGQFIAQIGEDRPSHICAPIIHKDRRSIGRLFADYFGSICADDPESLTMQARKHLREKFRRADMGITGAHFLVAETGQVCVVSNEGNARHTATMPRVLVTLTGIEKVLPRLEDLAVMLKLLARSSTGQAMGVYTTLFGGARSSGEKEGPEEFHIVLLDGGRSDVLAGEYRESLRCIRCAACLNACPVYRNIGGHAYGHIYSGPIGAVLAPLLHGIERFKELPQASTLCGACADACPVKIDLPELLLRLRRDIVRGRLNGRRERLAYRLWAWVMQSSLRYRLASWFQRRKLRTRTDHSGYVHQAPGIASAWTDVRDLPAPPARSFRQIWQDRKGK